MLQSFSPDRVLINNGAAGMPNFKGAVYGLATRIAPRASDEALYRARVGNLFVEAMPIRYDAGAWERHFAAQWPSGSDAHASYYRRIVSGPEYTLEQAVRFAG